MAGYVKFCVCYVTLYPEEEAQRVKIPRNKSVGVPKTQDTVKGLLDVLQHLFPDLTSNIAALQKHHSRSPTIHVRRANEILSLNDKLNEQEFLSLHIIPPPPTKLIVSQASPVARTWAALDKEYVDYMHSQRTSPRSPSKPRTPRANARDTHDVSLSASDLSVSGDGDGATTESPRRSASPRPSSASGTAGSVRHRRPRKPYLFVLSQSDDTLPKFDHIATGWPRPLPPTSVLLGEDGPARRAAFAQLTLPGTRCFWLIPGVVLAGPAPVTEQTLRPILQTGVRTFVDLRMNIEGDEYDQLANELLAEMHEEGTLYVPPAGDAELSSTLRVHPYDGHTHFAHSRRSRHRPAGRLSSRLSLTQTRRAVGRILPGSPFRRGGGSSGGAAAASSAAASPAAAAATASASASRPADAAAPPPAVEDAPSTPPPSPPEHAAPSPPSATERTKSQGRFNRRRRGRGTALEDEEDEASAEEEFEAAELAGAKAELAIEREAGIEEHDRDTSAGTAADQRLSTSRPTSPSGSAGAATLPANGRAPTVTLREHPIPDLRLFAALSPYAPAAASEASVTGPSFRMSIADMGDTATKSEDASLPPAPDLAVDHDARLSRLVVELHERAARGEVPATAPRARNALPWHTSSRALPRASRGLSSLPPGLHTPLRLLAQRAFATAVACLARDVTRDTDGPA